MAADKLNKHSNVSNVIRHASWEMQKAKKKKYCHYDLDTKSRISLEWDGKKGCVVPKKEQISISQRELSPFLPFVAHDQNVLGDVFAAPRELFDLNNLTGLLSYEVWQAQLSVQERDFLTQFLPEGAEPHKLVHELFAGNNFCFGNPFLKWGASICSGDYHPDAVLRQEQSIKTNKVAYYSELHEYHTKMIGSLQSWKERWTRSINPETFVHIPLRPKEDVLKSGPSHETGLQHGPQHDLCATSGSCSWNADDKSCNSDSPDLSASNGATGMSVSRTDLGNNNYNSSGGRSVARPKKREKIRKLNIECGDGAKYMSYIKVSKKQHERVKNSMKQSNFVLGNLDGFFVQPYEVFEEEERQKLHDYWLNLARKDVPAGFENWKSWQSVKLQLTKSLMEEMDDKLKLGDGPVLNLYETKDDEFIGEDEKVEQLNEEQHVDGETNETLLTALKENMEQNGTPTLQSEADLSPENHNTSNNSSQDSDENQHLPQIPLQNNNTHNFCLMPINTNNDIITESVAFPSSLVDYPGNINHTHASVGEPFPPPSAASEIWPLAPLPNVYYHQPTSVSQDYPSISQSSFLHRRSDGGDSFFNPYANQDRNDLLYSHYLGTSQLPRNINPSLPIDPRLNIQQTIYADGAGRFPLSREELLAPLDQVPGWPPPSHHSHHPHHRLSQSWFSDDVAGRDGWSGGVVPVPDHGLGSGSQVVDESLFSVLSECNGLRSGVHYGSTEMVQVQVQSGNYMDMGRDALQPPTANAVGLLPRVVGRGTGVNNNSNYMMSGNEGQLGWMNLPGGKSFGRIWNERELG